MDSTVTGKDRTTLVAVLLLVAATISPAARGALTDTE
jgi:hypothetical protein